MDEREIEIASRLEQIETAVFGNERVNAMGLMKRVSEIEDIVKRWQRTEWMMRGALAVMAVSTFANVAAVAKLLGLFP
jgi:hypothetical protein